MHQLTFHPTGPKSFILAQDGTFSPFQPQSDQVWELVLEDAGEFPFCLQTTYGLRAVSMRLFPIIIIENKRYYRQSQYHHPPTITHYAPDFLQISCSPISYLNMEMEIFVPQTDLLVGCIKMTNNNEKQQDLTLELAAPLVPMGEGIPTKPARKGINQFIAGQTGDLYPVLLMTGGPSAVTNPCPALSKFLNLRSNQSETLNWALASKSSERESLDSARTFLASDWKKTSQSHIMKHAGQTIEIHTGQTDWDAAFKLSQTIAITHLTGDDPQSSFFLKARLPDYPSFSPNKPPNLDDLTTLEATHLAEILLPARTHLLKRVIKNFIRRHDAGCLPSRRNASAFIEPLPEPPILAHLVWEVYRLDKDLRFLSDMFNDLCQITKAWCHRGDKQGSHPLLTWQDTDQLQLLTGSFAFDLWERTGRGLDIGCAESPALLSMLYQEVEALEKIAETLQENACQTRFKEQKTRLQERLKATWQDRRNRFGYVDCQSRLSPAYETLYQGHVREELKLDRSFKTPRRLAVHLVAADEHTRVCLLTITGKDAQGAALTERFKPLDIHWSLSTAHITTDNLYTSVESLTIKGMKPDDHLHLETADFNQGDITCLLPICCCSVSRQRLDAMVKTHLEQENPRNAHGIPETWQEERQLPDSLALYVNVLWNTLIIRGLLRAGYQDEAVSFFSKLMSTIVRGLRDFQGFFPYYHSQTGNPAGRRNALAGLAPLRLFLDLAGIRLFSPERVAIWGCSPFPWLVEVQWQGLSLRRERTQTHITFPDGTVYQTNSTEPVMITP